MTTWASRLPRPRHSRARRAESFVITAYGLRPKCGGYAHPLLTRTAVGSSPTGRCMRGAWLRKRLRHTAVRPVAPRYAGGSPKSGLPAPSSVHSGSINSQSAALQQPRQPSCVPQNPCSWPYHLRPHRPQTNGPSSGLNTEQPKRLHQRLGVSVVLRAVRALGQAGFNPVEITLDNCLSFVARHRARGVSQRPA